jgi:uncharacterized OB-fold protein
MTLSDEAFDAAPPPPAPAPDVDSAPFWQAARQHRFVLCRCQNCRTWLQPPLERCRHCGDPTSFEEASGDGEIYSFIIIRHPSVPAFVHRLPYAVALIDLAEGVRLPGRVLADPEEIKVGQRVRVDFDQLPGADEPAVVFRLAEGAGG